MINYDIIGTRISKIRKNLHFLKEIQNISLEDFLSDSMRLMATERCMQVTAQAILDIGNHIIAHFGWGKPESYREIISILVNNDVLLKDHKQKLEGLAGLRNILVHNYLAIDPKILYNDILTGISVIEGFIREIEGKYGFKNSK